LVPEPAGQGQKDPEEGQAGAAQQGSQRLAGLAGVAGQQSGHQDQGRGAQRQRVAAGIAVFHDLGWTESDSMRH